MKSFEVNRLTCFPIRYIVFSLYDSPLRLQSHNYEERYRTVEGELRKLVAMRGKSLAHCVPCLLQFIPEMDCQLNKNMCLLIIGVAQTSHSHWFQRQVQLKLEMTTGLCIRKLGGCVISLQIKCLPQNCLWKYGLVQVIMIPIVVTVIYSPLIIILINLTFLLH